MIILNIRIPIRIFWDDQLFLSKILSEKFDFLFEVLLKIEEVEIEDSSNDLYIKVVVSKTLIVIKDHLFLFIFH